MEFKEFRKFWESEEYAVTKSTFNPGCHYFIRKAKKVALGKYNIWKSIIFVYTKKEIKKLSLEDLQEHLFFYNLRQLFK